MTTTWIIAIDWDRDGFTEEDSVTVCRQMKLDRCCAKVRDRNHMLSHPIGVSS